MKKNSILRLIAVALLFASAIVVMESCRKQSVTETNDKTGLIEKSKAKQEHILAFKAKMEYYRDNPELKGGELRMQIDSTILDWEASINFTYCYTNLDLSDIIAYDTILDIPLVEGDSITVANASEKYYQNILETIRNKFIETEYTDKKLICVDLEPINNGDSLHVNIMVGIERNSLPPLLDWYFGEEQGECGTNNYALVYDAAIILAGEVRNHFYQAPPENCRWYFPHIVSYIDDVYNNPTNFINPDDEPYYYPNIIIDNYNDYLIYYAHENVQPGLSEDVRCVERLTEKGFYKQNYIDITQDYLDNAPYYLLGRMKYNTSDYEGLEIEENSVIILEHILTTKVGSRFIECSIEVEDILY